MNIAIYFSPWTALEKPTGVGQHVLRMVECLSLREDVSTRLISTRSGYAQAKGFLPASVQNIPVHFVPYCERLSRALLTWTNVLSVDSWVGNVDWIYCPKEQPVYTRRFRLAVTVHDVRALEPRIPGLERTGNWRSRASCTRSMRRIARRADRILTVSEFTRNRLMELCRIPAERMAVVGNGVSSAYFSPGCPERDSSVLRRFKLEGAGYVVAVGSLTWRKGGDVLVDVARILADRRSRLRIVVAGRRHDDDLVKQLATIKQAQPSFPIDLLGYVDDPELAALLRHSLALVFPSRYEGFGIPVMEAMAAGAPVISSRVAALPEVVGKAGLFVDGHAASDWVDAISSLDRNSIQRDALIAAGKERAQHCTWEACSRRVVDALRG